MSTSPPVRPNVSHGTSQLLDELDALMQRMLAVPVNELGDVPEAKDNVVPATETIAVSQLSPPPSPVRPGAPTAAPNEKMVVNAHQAAPALPTPHHRPEPERPPVRVPPVLPGPGEVPLGGFWPHPALQSPHFREPAGQPAPPHWSPSPGQRTPSSAVRPTVAVLPAASWWLHSLLWSNRRFDRWTGSLGSPGRWIQGPAGRMVLGWLGIGLLVGSLAWGLCNWFDWTW